MTVSFRIYRRLAQAFPHEFKLAYGTDVMHLGEDVIRDISSKNGITGVIRLIADIAIRVPLEYLSEMQSDMKYGLRALIKSPGFALVGIISMGLGIGLTTNIYSSKWELISRELPAATNARRLVMPWRPFSYYYIEQYRRQPGLFTGVAAFQTGVPFNVTFQNDINARAERVFGQIVSPEYFSVLGITPQRGRMFSAELEKPGASPTVVITDRFWRTRLNSSPDAIGQMLRLNGQPATIVGITPKDFNGVLPVNPSELFVSTTAPSTLAPELGNDVLHQRNAREFLALMCLAPGVKLESAEAALDEITRLLDQQDPTAPPLDEKGRRVTLVGAGTMVPIPRELKPVIMGFFAALMALTMTIACMNLANMLLARGANRRKELAIRLSVGASRFRIIRQMMSEGILLSLLGGLAGFPLAYVLGVLRSQLRQPSAIPVEPVPLPDWHAIVFVLALAVLCGVGFSLAPALRLTRADMTPALKEGSALQVTGYRRFGLRNLLMVAQLAGSLMLVLVTAFLVVGITNSSRIETRFDPHTMYLLCLDPVRDGYTPQQAQALFEKLPRQLVDRAAVSSVTLAGQAPYSIEDEDEDNPNPLMLDDSTGSSHVQISAVKETIGAGYFAELNEPVFAGHEFSEPDQRITPDASKALPVVLNETAARRFFGHSNAIGHRIRDNRQQYEVVGVVHDMSRGMAISRSVIYLPLTSRNFARPSADGMTIMVRSDAGRDALNSVRNAIVSMDPKLNIFNVRTLNEELERSREYNRFAVDTYGGIGLFGLILAAIGLAGVTAYAVAQRRKEIGIRMALGSRKGQVLRLVLREGAVLVGAGTILGFLGAVALAKALSALTNVFVDSVNVSTSDPRLLIGIPALLAGLAMVACYVPARRAATIDPLRALRES